MIKIMDDDQAETAYWNFDARVKGYGPWKGRPQSERDAFKAEWMAAYAHGEADHSRTTSARLSGQYD